MHGVAFDARCNRLGHGRGYYDCFVSRQRALERRAGSPSPQLTVIGLGLTPQLVETVPVTETDEANERLVTETLRRKFPNHAIVGEEAAAALGCVPEISPSVPTWVVDPVDGTQNFVHGVPLAVVSIGLCVGGVPALGVVYHAAADELYVGAPSAGGAWLNGERIAPDGATALPEALVATDVGYERSAEGIQKLCATSAAVLAGNVRALRIFGSTVLCLVWVACGRCSAFYCGVHKRDCPKPWDWCAGHAICAAVGVTFLRLDGPRIAPDAGDGFDVRAGSAVCAGTPALARAVRAAVLGGLADRSRVVVPTAAG